MKDLIEVINMNPPRPGDCWYCGGDCTGHNCGLPIFNGDLMSNDWQGEWGGVPACQGCYDKHERGLLPTCDHIYQHLLEGFDGGCGI